MKLNSTQVEQTLTQFEAHVIPEDHPLVPKLNELFGDHTFFLDRNGLNILEPLEPDQSSQAHVCKVVCVADWNDADPPSLEPHEPVPTELVIQLEAKH